MINNNNIINYFKNKIPIKWEPEKEQVTILENLINFSTNNGYQISDKYHSSFIEAINQKLNINSKSYRLIMDTAFAENIKFNYGQKNLIRTLLDKGNYNEYVLFLKDNHIFNKNLEKAFIIAEEEKTISKFEEICETDEKSKEVLNSIFSRYAFNLFDKHCSIEFFSKEESSTVNYFDFLSNKYPDLCDRKHALSFLEIDKTMFQNSYEEGCNRILKTIKKEFEEMNNHCEMIVYIPQIKILDIDIQWRLFSDVTLYAEKHFKEKVNKTYFRWKKIGDTTKEYIDNIIPYNAEFDFAFQGFVYKDCFVIGNGENYDIMLVFEKNKRDERPINCPSCFSSEIQGNSYPILNVKSWECKNPLCPDRSKYNRGKRYSFMYIYRQYQLQNEENRIPSSSISKWRLDCNELANKDDAFEMALRHYSCMNDTVIIYSTLHKKQEKVMGREIIYKDFYEEVDDLLNAFKSSSYFYRFIQKDFRDIRHFAIKNIGNATLIQGDSYDVLRSMEDDSIDAIVTSPPYYNAKSYSQWKNIYCYLYDMYNISRELYRVMKNGGVYLFNIFDYFDNENNIALSAMGDKRMILGAYMIDILQRAGFNVTGNIIWNKGEIQGNRSFNQGNMGPYYQAPLNCWEHMLIISKGDANPKFDNLFSKIEKIHPVVKMVRGNNILGHDAPYPKEIPELLLSCLVPNDKVLDPFVGSGTTLVAAKNYKVKSIGIEKDSEYFKLSEKILLNQ